MGIYKFIKIKGADGKNTGYFVPNMYKLYPTKYELKRVGFNFILERIKGWSIWYVCNEEDYRAAVKTLKELKKTRIFDFMVRDV